MKALEPGSRAAESPATARAAKPRRRRIETCGWACVSESVVSAPLLRFLQDVVGFLNLLKFLLGVLVARVDVGVELAGQPAIGLLDLGFRSAASDAQDFVVVPFFHDRIIPDRPRPSEQGRADLYFAVLLADVAPDRQRTWKELAASF